MKKILSLALAILLPGCWWYSTSPKRIAGSGSSRVEMREIKAADTLEMSGPGSIIFTQGQPASLAISADDNLISHISIHSDSKKLSISVDPQVQLTPKSPLIYTITLPELAHIELNGAIAFKADTLTSKKLSFELNGASRIDANIDTQALEIEASGASILNLEGAAHTQKIELQGASHYNAGQLRSDRCQLELSGATRATVQVAKELEVEADGAAFVAYIGNPHVKEKLQGSASVNKVGS